MMVHVGFDLVDLRGGRDRGDVLVVVDVLSFSTAVAAGTSRGVVFFPAGSRRRAAALALEKDGVASVPRRARKPGEWSLSPVPYLQATSGLRVALRSPNGARMAVAARGAPAVVVAGLVNASAAGAAATAGAKAAGCGVTVVACGERSSTPGRRRRRFAAEDFLGAGAVAAAVDLPRTGEAEVAVRAFESCRADLADVLLQTRSGAELVAAGFREDVLFAAGVDTLRSVPLLQDGELRSR
jgi:2-phosphosulfolactate phosphatase